MTSSCARWTSTTTPRSPQRHEARERLEARIERPWAKTWSLREMTVQLRSRAPSERLEPLVALVDGQVAGVAHAVVPAARQHALLLGRAGRRPRPAPPRRRRRPARASWSSAPARTADAPILVGVQRARRAREDHPYVRFAERHGFTYANTEIRRVLDLPVAPSC